jgi:hypothetical protein
MASGAIAYDRLAADDPAAIDHIRQLMTAHPDRARFDVALGMLAGPARDRMLFELMARWPDDVRHTRFAHEDWHQELRIVSGWRLFAPLRFGGAEPAFQRNLDVARDMKADAGERAVALCWLFHLIADMHQPLHAGHRMTGQFLATDRAGTIAWVRRGADQRPISLHAFWDRAADLPGSDMEAAEKIARGAAAVAPSESVPRGGGSAEAQFHDWTKESEALAATVAYRGSGLEAAARQEDAPLVSARYIGEARSVSERRLGEAGIRIARLIAALFPAR